MESKDLSVELRPGRPSYMVLRGIVCDFGDHAPGEIDDDVIDAWRRAGTPGEWREILLGLAVPDEYLNENPDIYVSIKPRGRRINPDCAIPSGFPRRDNTNRCPSKHGGTGTLGRLEKLNRQICSNHCTCLPATMEEAAEPPELRLKPRRSPNVQWCR